MEIGASSKGHAGAWAVIGGLRSVFFVKHIERWMSKDNGAARNTERRYKRFRLFPDFSFDKCVEQMLGALEQVSANNRIFSSKKGNNICNNKKEIFFSC